MALSNRALQAAALVGLLVVCGAGVGWRGRGGPSARPTLVEAANDRVPYDPELVSKTIAFWKKQAARDNQGALERRELAGAYLARQRETGDIADAVLAEDAARQSLQILRRNNSVAMIRLCRALIAQHRFPEALPLAKAVAAGDPQGNCLVADVQIELGNNDEARAALDATVPESDDLNYAAVRARLEQIDGRPDASLRFLREAQRVVASRPDIPAEIAAWADAMVGHSLVVTGKFDDAETSFQKALRVFPRDYRALTGMAEAAAWRGDWRASADWGEKAVAVCPQNPEALKLVGDARTALGQDVEAARWYAQLDDLAHSFPRIYDRHWALFLADKGRDLDEALALARADLELRHDVHAHDTLAWVLFKKGRIADADAAMHKALARGTREATLFYHAGMIARAADDPARAKDYFSRARAINPGSVPLRWLRWLDAQSSAASRVNSP